MTSFVRLAVAGLLGVGLGRRVAAQATTSAVCTTDQWTSNQEGQSPCLVAAALQGTCDGGKFNIPPLPEGREYTGPLQGGGNECTCSTVTFSMVAACGACQGAGVESWTDWITNCSASQISVSKFPSLAIPGDITIPSWAFLDVTTNGVWDSTAAFNAHNSGSPDSTIAGPQPTSGPGSSGPSSGGSSKSHSSPNIAAIAGGAAGGVIFLALLLGIGICLCRRSKRKNRNAPSAMDYGGNYYGEKGMGVGMETPVSGAVSPAPVPVPFYANTMPVVQEEPQRLYDPADPSTFPAFPGQNQTPLPRYASTSPDHPAPPPFTTPTPPQDSGQYNLQTVGSGPAAYGQPPFVGQQGYDAAPVGGYSSTPEVVGPGQQFRGYGASAPGGGYSSMPEV